MRYKSLLCVLLLCLLFNAYAQRPYYKYEDFYNNQSKIYDIGFRATNSTNLSLRKALRSSKGVIGTCGDEAASYFLISQYPKPLEFICFHAYGSGGFRTAFMQHLDYYKIKHNDWEKWDDGVFRLRIILTESQCNSYAFVFDDGQSIVAKFPVDYRTKVCPTNLTSD